MLGANPGQLFDPSFDSLSERSAQRIGDLNSLLSTALQASLLPSATINTYGAGVDLTPPAPHITVRPFSVSAVLAGVDTETITVQVIATNEDASTANATKTATVSGSIAFTASALAGLFTAGKKISKFTFKMKSSIAASGASAVVNAFALNGG